MLRTLAADTVPESDEPPGGRWQGPSTDVYRRVLVVELGMEPSPELRELEQAILRQDPTLVVAPPPASPITSRVSS